MRVTRITTTGLKMNIKLRPESGPRESRADEFDRYVFDKRGRPDTPHLLGGSRAVFRAVGRAYAIISANPIISFDTGFEEEVSLSDLSQIFGFAHRFFTVGLDEADICHLAGAHLKSKPTASGDTTKSSDWHMAYARLLVRSGKQWSPYFAQADSRGLIALQEIVNYDFNLSSPKDGSRSRLVFFPDQNRNTAATAEWKAEFVAWITERHAQKPFTSQNDFVRAAGEFRGISGTATQENVTHLLMGPDSICVKGVLATRWYYEEPTKYHRKEYAAYLADLKHAVLLRKTRHERLYKQGSRHSTVPWLDTLGLAKPKVIFAFGSDIDKSTDERVFPAKLGLVATPRSEREETRTKPVLITPAANPPQAPNPRRGDDEQSIPFETIRTVFTKVIEAHREEYSLARFLQSHALIPEFFDCEDDGQIRVKKEKERVLERLRNEGATGNTNMLDAITDLDMAIAVWNEAQEKARERQQLERFS